MFHVSFYYTKNFIINGTLEFIHSFKILSILTFPQDTMSLNVLKHNDFEFVIFAYY